MKILSESPLKYVCALDTAGDMEEQRAARPERQQVGDHDVPRVVRVGNRLQRRADNTVFVRELE